VPGDRRDLLLDPADRPDVAEAVDGFRCRRSCDPPVRPPGVSLSMMPRVNIRPAPGATDLIRVDADTYIDAAEARVLGRARWPSSDACRDPRVHCRIDSRSAIDGHGDRPRPAATACTKVCNTSDDVTRLPFTATISSPT